MKYLNFFTLTLMVLTVSLIIIRFFIPFSSGILFFLSTGCAISGYIYMKKGNSEITTFTWAIWIPTALMWLLFWIIFK